MRQSTVGVLLSMWRRQETIQAWTTSIRTMDIDERTPILARSITGFYSKELVREEPVNSKLTFDMDGTHCT